MANGYLDVKIDQDIRYKALYIQLYIYEIEEFEAIVGSPRYQVWRIKSPYIAIHIIGFIQAPHFG